ncbi:hypothetical protein POTOM_031424 [Populus tomentosa]|uniref:Uncharacterized protein n=1 Tax=Populus tomentosa TaxID=118781 RepID=A0A8X8CRL3_POPTO|nr:hypothetical protein POTOM_031424 [Populus tomentosa]
MKWILRDIEAIGDKPAFVSRSSRRYQLCKRLLMPWKPDWSNAVYGTDGGCECWVPYSLKFNMPGKSSESTGTLAPGLETFAHIN